MSYLVDSDVLIDGLRGRRPALDLIDRLAASGLALSIVSLGEIYDGAYSDPQPEEHLQEARVFLQGFGIVELTDAAMVEFARERARLRRSGQLIPDMDLLIAATALAHDLELVTRNDRHFRRVEGLRLYVPS